MKNAAIAAVLAASISAPALAQPMAGPAPNNGACIQTQDIDHTHTVDANHVLFYLKNGKVWENTLKGPCPGLNFHGFVVNTHDQKLCSNEEGITVIATHEACALGNFTPYKAPAAH
jgi:hypothetical protein